MKAMRLRISVRKSVALNQHGLSEKRKKREKQKDEKTHPCQPQPPSTPS
jgi:hypothetical protein